MQRPGLTGCMQARQTILCTPGQRWHCKGEVNAFATVGGHVIVLGGLLEKIPHENALVMLLGHEIGHIAHRDPVKALARGVAVLTLIGVLTGFSEAGALGRSMETAGLLTTLSFSRDQERAADEAGLETLRAWYGHTSGAADLFRALHDSTGAGKELPAMFSSHPGIDERIEHMSAHQDHRSTQALTGALADYVEARRQKLVDSGTGPRP